MKGIVFLSRFITVFLTLGITSPAPAQVTSDQTTNTTVNQSNNNFNILNGMQKGNNLFHSFKEFSIPQGSSAIFNNSTDVVNIINRVTGGNISNIDGLIKASGNANLFLINPAGIVFGENAKLDIGGSFFGSTASSILFEDEFEFSAVNPESTPLLTVSVPVGLQMGKNPGAIKVNGSGHNLIAQDATFSPYINPGNANSLQVKPGKTLFLIGGDIQLDGSILTAESGRIELASLNEGEVNLTQTSKDLTLNDIKTSNFGNIQLAQRTLVDVSGASGGEVNIQGNQVSVKDGSVVMVQNRGIQPAGDINLKAKSVVLSGAIPDTQIRSSLMSETLPTGGDTGNINITTERLKIEDGASVFTRTFGLGKAGFIYINASESIDITGVSAINPNQFSAIGSATLSPGKSGDVKLSTKNLSVLDSGVIATTTFSNGSAGNITIDSENTQVAGLSRGIFRATAITATTFGQGDAGSIDLNTQTLSIGYGGTVNTTSHNSGNSGSVTINATKSIEVAGGNEIQAANINSSVLPQLAFIGKFPGLPQVPTGDAGNVTVNTPYLKLSDFGSITTRNAGTGNAGRLKVNADLIKIENQAGFAARSNSGEGGDILVQADSLQMRRESYISTDTRGEGNGGNININTNTLVALQNSDITANAENSFGGKVTINAYGIFGTQFRENLTLESDITASSQLGAEFSGIVELNTPGIDPSSGIAELPTDVIDSDNQIAAGCSSNAGSSFVATGRGGIPQNPNEQVDSSPSWSDIRDLSAYRQRNNNTVENTQKLDKTPIVEATSFIRNQDGEIELIASQNKPLTTQGFNCRGMNTL
ncbi:filamentous hemagglutinin family N-terminal domain protein [Rivularia sp. PCC 7116]|uniref:two-partner secretion domain-containing protein n=1 Tax=Rivularia sp. PCC 7116 TaxID=373994 RepID=UPI00029EC61C|nr:filamentous hemagglutinin N-terminal domain-containing protein [Rivularia sp. PCC 7116]AFY54830.1 filamentous hemagglutinin family N-terminal domain protein [Rivularia sp. PCC 7116]